MAKDPAFLFYSQDFIVGTMTMSFEDKGKYIQILSMMHQTGRLNEETIRLLVGSVSVILKSKFEIDKKGFWYNVRLEDEVEKRKTFTESRRMNGSKGGRPKKEKPNGKPSGKPSGNHMEDENENENEVKSLNKNKFVTPQFEEIKSYFFEKLQSNEQSKFEAEKFIDFYSSKGWMVGRNKMKDWKASVRNWIKGIKTQKNERGDQFSEEAIRARMEGW